MLIPCMVKNCSQRISSDHLMCTRHWTLVDATTKAEIQKRRKGWKDKGAAREYLANWMRGRILI